MKTTEEIIKQMQSYAEENFDDIAMVFHSTGFNAAVVEIKRSATLVAILNYIKKHAGFEMLIGIFGVDHLGRENRKRFELNYHLLNLRSNIRLTIKLQIDEGESVPTLCAFFTNANWYEREAFDMFGIEFKDHPNLKRILSNYDFEGFPLRKDFPLSGHKEYHYDLSEKKVVETPVSLDQSYRNFEFEMPWSGAQKSIKETE